MELKRLGIYWLIIISQEASMTGFPSESWETAIVGNMHRSSGQNSYFAWRPKLQIVLQCNAIYGMRKLWNYHTKIIGSCQFWLNNTDNSARISEGACTVLLSSPLNTHQANDRPFSSRLTFKDAKIKNFEIN